MANITAPAAAGNSTVIRDVVEEPVRGTAVTVISKDRLKERQIIKDTGVREFVSPLDNFIELVGELGLSVGGAIVPLRESTTSARQKQMMKCRGEFISRVLRPHGIRVIKRFHGPGQTGKGPDIAPCVVAACVMAQHKQQRQPGVVFPVVVDVPQRLLRAGVAGDDSHNNWRTSGRADSTSRPCLPALRAADASLSASMMIFRSLPVIRSAPVTSHFIAAP